MKNAFAFSGLQDIQFYNITLEYKKEHEERMETERDDRKRTFRQMVDKSKSVVADELVFTATHTFFNDMSKEEIKNFIRYDPKEHVLKNIFNTEIVKDNYRFIDETIFNEENSFSLNTSLIYISTLN